MELTRKETSTRIKQRQKKEKHRKFDGKRFDGNISSSKYLR